MGDMGKVPVKGKKAQKSGAKKKKAVAVKAKAPRAGVKNEEVRYEASGRAGV